MFKNLLAEMGRIGITKMDISRDLDYVYNTVQNKFKGKTEWVNSEMFAIRDKYFPDKTIEYLFEKEESKGGG